MRIKNLSKLGSIGTACLLLAACGGSGDGSNKTGELSLSIADAPIHDAQSVNIDFLGAVVKPAEGPAIEFFFCKDPINPDVDPPIVQQTECTDSDPHVETIDLLEQTGGASALLLDAVEVPAGRINWVRLVLADPAGEIVLSTGSFPLSVPSGSQTGLKLNRGFEVPEGGEARVFIDFVVRKSIVEVHSTVPPSYKLKPSLRLVDEFGAVEGEVDATLMTTECLGGSIYVYPGAGAAVDDIDRDKGDPLTSAMVVADGGSSTGFSYYVNLLEPGDYTLAFVCAGGVSADGGATFSEPPDDPDMDDALKFTVAADTATVLDGQTDRVDIVNR